MTTHCFRVFGSLVAVDGAPGNWSAFLVGAEGKRRPAPFIIPGFLAEDELSRYLADLFHESATPTSGEVYRIE